MNTICLNNSFFYRIFLSAILFFIFILPLKFGIPAGIPDINAIPENITMWFFSFWPPLLFSLISAFLLICCVSIPSITFNCKNYVLTIPLLFTLLAFCSLTGFLKATCMDFPIQECLYIFGLSAFSILIILIVQNKTNPSLILKIITISTLLVTCYGIYQYISGFENTREYVSEAFFKKNILLPEEVKTRLNNNFIFSTFTISNNFAAHLILTAPICLYMLLYSDLLKTKILRYILTSIAMLMIATALLLTGSRAAIISLVLAIIILPILLSMKNKKVLLMLFTIIPVTIVILLLIPKDSDSVLIRLDYLQTGVTLLKNNLFPGTGWGEFFHSYTYLKKFLTTEAPHDPHNFIISMGAQAGITALIIAILIIIIPIFLIIKKLNNYSLKEKFKTLEFPILLGFTAWCIHSLMDINFQIPGTTATAITLCIIMTKTDNFLFSEKFFPVRLKTILLFYAIMIILPGFYRLRGEYYISKLSNVCYPSFLSVNSAHNNFSEAEKLFETAIEAVPYSPFPWAMFGDYAIRNKMKDKAEICFTNAIRLSPKRANFYYRLATIQMENRKTGYAMKNIEIAAKLFPYKYNILYDKMKTSYYKGL